MSESFRLHVETNLLKTTFNNLTPPPKKRPFFLRGEEIFHQFLELGDIKNLGKNGELDGTFEVLIGQFLATNPQLKFQK
jgi:hypothetical protein